MNRHETLPWQPVSPGFSLKVLRGGGDDDTRVLLLRVEPGTLVPLHRHAGEVHAYNLSGSRVLLETGEVVGPGGYVYEPPGNVDSWMATGDEPAVILVTVRGTMETLGEGGRVTATSTTSSVTESYRRFADQPR
jgi:2,4'-dihydroxyacetophenone dioxygenase